MKTLSALEIQLIVKNVILKVAKAKTGDIKKGNMLSTTLHLNIYQMNISYGVMYT